MSATLLGGTSYTSFSYAYSRTDNQRASSSPQVKTESGSNRSDTSTSTYRSLQIKPSSAPPLSRLKEGPESPLPLIPAQPALTPSARPPDVTTQQPSAQTSCYGSIATPTPENHQLATINTLLSESSAVGLKPGKGQYKELLESIVTSTYTEYMVCFYANQKAKH